MKKIIYLLLLAALFAACEKKDDDNSRDALPAATQTGAGTFACYVDGKSFIDPSNQYFNCYYQNVDGEYHFGIGGLDDDYENTNAPWGVNLFADNKELEVGKTYTLTSEAPGNAYGQGFFSYSATEVYSPQTSPEYTGELTITRLDHIEGKNIISGTFWFDVKHPKTGATVKIREGRFDTLFLD